MAKSVKKETIITISIATVVLVATLLSVITTSSLAYFRAIFDKTGSHNILVELIFDRLNEEGFIAYQTKYTDIYGADFNPDPTAEWGTRDNPYVISEKYHVQNLSVLQNASFFEKIKDANGNPRQAYFLVCKPDGTPVVVDCNGMTIAPIGTDALPFTGVIHGAPAEGEDSYKGYGASISGIANLTVKSTLDEPDLGFFGKLGYYGTKNIEQDSFGNDYAVITDGYAAQIQDLLLADVTISSRRSLAQTLTDWWNSLTGHINYKDVWKETHHVGIITGHAEFATIKDVSVYYSENVAAFDLISNESGSNTNYYSATGLIGLLDCVNPTIGSNGVLDGSNAVSDSALVGDGSNGGGGDESGTMTGYFLAKNLYDRHESHLSANEIKDKYSVIEMTDADGKALFETVTMRERDEPGTLFNPDRGWEYYNYFYFQDTVFTFAMTTKVPANSSGTATGNPVDDKVDYIQKIWKIDEETQPTISSAADLDSLQYGPDPTATPPISYRLTPATSITDGGYYVLTYHDKDNKCLYVLNLLDTQKFTRNIPLIGNDEVVLGITYNNEEITTLDLKGLERTIYDYAFQYVKETNETGSIKRPSSEHKLGITSGTDANGNKYTSATTIVNNGAPSGGDYDGSTAFVHYWSFTKEIDSSNRYRITGRCTFGGRGGFLWLQTYYRYYWSKLTFTPNNGSIVFDNYIYGSETDRNNSFNSAEYSKYDYFTIFEVKANIYDDAGNITNESETGNKLLASKNIFPTKDFYDFDPSKYVLQFVPGVPNDTSDDSYKLVPIRSLKLNNGRGELLTELNHIVKLAQTTPSNFQLQIGNAIGGAIGNWIGQYTDTNTGGVLNTTIGTSNKEVYSIPTGMIAFEINKATEENPSYINIIVAIEPNQESVGRVGLWKMNKETWSQGFDINGYMDAFMLPVSKTATSPDDIEYAIKISERIEEKEENGKKLYNVVTDANGNNETSYLYLGGDIALVSYTFKITDISDQTVFMLGSLDGPLSVAYFSVTGAAGAGNDGMSGSPLGNIDFVYDFNNKIITTDKHFEGDAPLINLEDHENYYPSYLFVGMLPGENEKIQYEVIKIRRYIDTTDNSGTKRHIVMTGEDKAEIRGVSPIMEDYQDDIDSN